MKELNTHYMCNDCKKEFKYYDMESDDMECLYCDSKNIQKIDYIEKIKTIDINAKCSDLCYTTFYDKDNQIIKEIDGYAPDFLGGGDYIDLKIDIETGQIIGWKKPSEQELQNFFDNN